MIAEERRSADTVAFQLTARSGVRDDDGAPGITALTSRMLGQGTVRRPSESDLLRAAAAVGGSLSRGFDVETCQVTSVMPSREADLGFDLLSDIVTNSLFDPDTLERQRGILLQDLARRRADPGSLIDDLYRDAIYGGHPAGRPFFGTPESAQGHGREQVRDQYERHWGAANLVLTVVGRISVEQTLEKARQYFGGLRPGTRNQRVAVPPPPLTSTRTVRGAAGRQQVTFRLGYQAPPLTSDDRYPMIVLNFIMTGSSGRLFEEVRNQRGLAYVAGSAYSAVTDAGTWFATAGVDPENLDAALAVVRDEIARLRDDLTPAEEHARAISQIAGGQIPADETNAARAGRLSSQEVLGTPTTEELVRRIRLVTPADVQRVARTYFDPARSLLAVVEPSA
ncbi:MAG: pitrilysin family protein [Dehalococcoidia bacterium]